MRRVYPACSVYSVCSVEIGAGEKALPGFFVPWVFQGASRILSSLKILEIRSSVLEPAGHLLSIF